MTKIVNTNEVFGVSNDQIKTYIEREKVDTAFVDGLTKNKHIVVFGASKQGKTALTNRHLSPKDYIKVNCSPTAQTIDIYKSLLRQIGIVFEESHTKTESSERNISAEVKAKVKFPLMGELEAGFSPKGGGAKESSSTFRELEYNLDLAQDISELLEIAKFQKRIILENFHYLEDKVQIKLAMDLRTFEDYHIRFIILGIWRERNRLTQFNGDLTDRLIEIPVEPWGKTTCSEL
jgi:Cdc6-like AAA superfamily ATPase